MIRPALALTLALAAACAGPSQEIGQKPVPLDTGPKMLPAGAPPRPSKAIAFDPKAYVAQFDTPIDCEVAARQLAQENADQGWSVLKACIERPRYPRGPFVQLGLLAREEWAPFLTTRPDAGTVLTRLIAQRGGDVEGDIDVLQKSRTPVFTLQAAVRQPDLYKGRLLIIRGRMGDFKMEGGTQAAMVSEISLRGATREAQVGRRVEYSAQGSYQNSTGYSAQGAYKDSSRVLEQRHENEKAETGRRFLGRLAKPDPFMEPNKEFVFLGRFDGMRRGVDEYEGSFPVVTVFAYFAPSAFVVE